MIGTAQCVVRRQEESTYLAKSDELANEDTTWAQWDAWRDYVNNSMTTIQSQISTHQMEGGQIVGRLGQIEQRLGDGRSEQVWAMVGQMRQEVQGVRQLVERNEEEYRIGMVQEGLK